MVGGSLVGNGPTFQTPLLTANATWYAEAVRGPLYFVDDLLTTTTSNINWNGAMFDVVAQTNLVIDSFGVKINTLGTQAVGIYRKAGSHIGSQTNSGAWTFLGTRTVQVTNANALTNVPLGNIAVNAGDTAGIYVYLANGNSNLSYQSASQTNSRTDGQIEIITGSGVSAGFSATFFPRDWNGQVYYHYGNRPQGDCSTGRIPVEAVVSIPTVNLPADTIIDVNGSITLDAGAGFAQYTWSSGGTAQTEALSGATLGNGIHVITVTVTDANGCTATDDIIVGVANLVGLQAGVNEKLLVSPNPAKDVLRVEWQGMTETGTIFLRNAFGVVVAQRSIPAFESVQTLQLDGFAAGVYFLEWQAGEQVLRERVLIAK